MHLITSRRSVTPSKKIQGVRSLFKLESLFINWISSVPLENSNTVTSLFFTKQCVTVTSVKLNLSPLDKFFHLICISLFLPPKEKKKRKRFPDTVCTSWTDMLLFQTLHCLSSHGRGDFEWCWLFYDSLLLFLSFTELLRDSDMTWDHHHPWI